MLPYRFLRQNGVEPVLGECLLMALSGRSDDRVAMSGFGRKADMPN
jgi:hypothetical protein